MTLAVYRHYHPLPASIPSNIDPAQQPQEDDLSPCIQPPTPPANQVALVWYNQPGSGAHVAIAVNDTPYGFCMGKPTKEACSLKQSCQKRMGQKNLMAVVQEIQVSSDEREVIKALCQQKSLPSITCMHATAKVLQTVDIHVPFPVCLQPDASRLYLKQLNHPRLSKQMSYGSLRFPHLGIITQTFILLGYSYVLPRWIFGASWGHKIGLMSLITMSSLQVKAFYRR